MTPKQLAALAVLANGIIPADAIDAGATTCGISCAGDLQTAQSIAREIYNREIDALSAAEVHEFLGVLRERMPAFFLQLRLDVSARYLSDPEVSRRIGFPGASIDNGGYPDFDQAQ